MVEEMWGPEWNMNDIAYEMSNSRQFECTDKYTTGIYNPYLRTFVVQENLVAWYRYKTSILSDVNGVNTWKDISGMGNDLLQSVISSRPQLQSDGSIHFNGTSQYLRAVFGLSQPSTVYFLGSQERGAASGIIWDGSTDDSMALQKAFLVLNNDNSVSIRSPNQVADNSGWPFNTEAVICAVFNAANSLLRINNLTTTGNPGSSAANGFTLGVLGGLGGFFGNFKVKEIAIFSVAHDTSTQNTVMGYLSHVHPDIET
jgi:hypothetical protein